MGGAQQQACTICRGLTRTYLRCAEGVLLQCTRCKLISLAKTATKKQLFALYEDTFYDKQAERFNTLTEKLIYFFRYVRSCIITRIAQKKEGGKVLDVGFSRGYTLLFLRRKGWKCYGINVSRHVVEHGKKIGVDAIRGELPDAGYKTNFFDVVTFWHVLEHVVEPHKYIKESARILKPGGKLIIEIPNIDSIPANIFKCNWLALDIPRHLSHFTPATLKQLLEKHDFAIDCINFFSLEHSTFSSLQSMLNVLIGKNALLESLKKEKKIPMTQRAFHALLGIVLLPFAFLFAVFCAMLRQGDIIRVYCTKR